MPFPRPAGRKPAKHNRMKSSRMPDKLPRNEPAGKRKQAKEANRAAILEAARALFGELGYGETSVRDIIRRTGLASGTFYNYFRSKEEIFKTLRDETAQQVRPRLQEERSRAASFEDFIHRTFRSFFEIIDANRDLYAIIRRNAGLLRLQQDTPEIIAGFDELRIDVEQAVKRGLLPAIDTDYFVAALIGVALEVGDAMIQRKVVEAEAAARFASRLFTGGIPALPRAE